MQGGEGGAARGQRGLHQHLPLLKGRQLGSTLLLRVLCQQHLHASFQSGKHQSATRSVFALHGSTPSAAASDDLKSVCYFTAEGGFNTNHCTCCSLTYTLQATEPGIRLLRP